MKRRFFIILLLIVLLTFLSVSVFASDVDGSSSDPVDDPATSSPQITDSEEITLNPDKFQYSIDDIKAHGGIDVRDLLKPTSAERYSIISEIIEYVKDSDITEFFELMDYSRQYKFDTWFPVLCDSGSFVVNTYIKSNRERVRQAKQDYIDDLTHR